MFSTIITVGILVVSKLVPAEAWGSPVTVRNPKAFATSKTVVSAVGAITTALISGSTAPSEADINNLVAHVAKDAPSLAAALSAWSPFDSRTYEKAILLNVLEVRDSSCPLQGNNEVVNVDNHKKTKKKSNSETKNKNQTAAASISFNNGGSADCATEHDVCMASCSSTKGGLFGRGKTPAAGTCTLVCTVVQQGCQRCIKKRKRHASKVGGVTWKVFTKARINAKEAVEIIENAIQTIAWAAISPAILAMKQSLRVTTLLVTLVEKNALGPLVHYLTDAMFWAIVARTRAAEEEKNEDGGRYRGRRQPTRPTKDEEN
eukprot:g13811.t1